MGAKGKKGNMRQSSVHEIRAVGGLEVTSPVCNQEHQSTIYRVIGERKSGNLTEKNASRRGFLRSQEPRRTSWGT